MLTTARLISYSQPPEGELYVGSRCTGSHCVLRPCLQSSGTNNRTKRQKNSYDIYANTHIGHHWRWTACIEIETTRDIAHQIVRHRSFSFQEFSQRYAEPSAMGDAFTKRECRLQDTEESDKTLLRLKTTPHWLTIKNTKI